LNDASAHVVSRDRLFVTANVKVLVSRQKWVSKNASTCVLADMKELSAEWPIMFMFLKNTFYVFFGWLLLLA